VSLRRSRQQSKHAFRSLVVARMPRKRATMHLDTIFSLIENNKALVYPRMLSPGAAEQVTAFVVDLPLSADAPIHLQPKGAFLDTLEDLGLPIEAVAAGGSHPLHQDREQWTDGANALVLRPGLIVGYERNRRTAAELSGHGYRSLRARDVLELSDTEASELMADTSQRVLIPLPATELTRARGGPHCLTRDLQRAPIHAP